MDEKVMFSNLPECKDKEGIYKILFYVILMLFLLSTSFTYFQGRIVDSQHFLFMKDRMQLEQTQIIQAIRSMQNQMNNIEKQIKDNAVKKPIP